MNRKKTSDPSEITLALKDLQERNKKSFRRDIIFKIPNNPTKSGKPEFSILPGFTNRWYHASGKTLDKAKQNAIDKVKKNWPIRSSKIDRSIITIKAMMKIH